MGRRRQQDGWFDFGYTDAIVNGMRTSPHPFTGGVGLVIVGQPVSPDLPAGPVGGDIVDGLSNAPRATRPATTTRPRRTAAP